MSETKKFIDRDMVINDIVTLAPQASEIMAAYGLHCFNCNVGGVESLLEGCQIHGFSEEIADAIADDINESIATMPEREKTLIITKDAAVKLKEIAKEQDHEGEGLEVITDAHGGFCLEFITEPKEEDHEFCCTAVSDLKFYASDLALMRIGGSTIDYRDERFKLDLPENDPANKACDCKEGGCDCTDH